jgi:hypothetical protein
MEKIKGENSSSIQNKDEEEYHIIDDINVEDANN